MGMQGVKQLSAIKLRDGAVLEVYKTDTPADYSVSMQMLDQLNIQPVSYQRIFTAIDENSDVAEKLTGWWYWLSGKGIRANETMTWDSKGELINKGGESNLDRLVGVSKGTHPMSLVVLADKYVKLRGYRYALGADTLTWEVSPRIIGIRNSESPEKLHSFTERLKSRIEKLV